MSITLDVLIKTLEKVRGQAVDGGNTVVVHEFDSCYSHLTKLSMDNGLLVIREGIWGDADTPSKNVTDIEWEKWGG